MTGEKRKKAARSCFFSVIYAANPLAPKPAARIAPATAATCAGAASTKVTTATTAAIATPATATSAARRQAR